MTSIELSGQAEIDLTEIYFYSLHAFGVTQADLYVRDLKKVCLSLADSPKLGRLSKHLPDDIRRHEHAAHVIFYREVRHRHIVVVRFLGLHQEPGLHLIDETAQ